MSEDRVADACVGARAVADRVEVADRAGRHLQQPDAQQRSQPDQQRVLVALQHAVVDGVLDHQGRCDRASLPEEPRNRRADDARALRADDGAHESPRRATLRVVFPHGSKYPAMSNPRTAIEERFPRPSVMGVVNVTPDSFSDGGLHLDPDVAAAAARRMVEEGAAVVDVGGESTRPGSEGVPLDEELRRVVPVLERLEGVPISIDTAKAEVARRALGLGAELVNDVTALRGDPQLAEVVAESGAYLCLMHMQGEPRTMQVEPTYDDVVGEVAAFLEQRLRFALDAGIAEERICLDPGIGFGKTVAQNFELVRRLPELAALGRPILIGFSRKSSLGRVVGDAQAKTGPLSASVAAAVAAYDRGASILRVHDVREHVEALTVAAAVVG